MGGVGESEGKVWEGDDDDESVDMVGMDSDFQSGTSPWAGAGAQC
jgi:hypothetical protein